MALTKVSKSLISTDTVFSVDALGGVYGNSSSPVSIAVTVASKTAGHPYNGDGSSSAYFLDGVEAPAILLNGADDVTSDSGYYYRFDQANSSNSGHPLRFYLDAAKNTAYTTGVTTSGTPGNAGAYTQIDVDADTPKVIYYQCSSHAYMGNYAAIPASKNFYNLAVGGVTITSTGAELNILDGVTSTTAELNILDGVTSTTAELNILDGVTSTAAELNILDGVTATATEINRLDGVASVIKTAGLETIYVPAAAMYPNTTDGSSDLEQVELSNGPELKCLDFAAAADDFAQFTVIFPKSWNEGTVTFQAFWTVTGTNTGTVAWGLSGISFADNASINTAFGTQVVATAKAFSGTSNDMTVSAVSGAVTIANAAVDTQTYFQVSRDVSADSQSGDARLLGIKLFFTTDAANDA